MNLNPFQFFSPTKIVFGAGAFHQASKLCQSLGRRGLLVADTWLLEHSPRIVALQKAVAAEGGTLVTGPRISPNPKSSEINRAAEQCQAEECSYVVGVGGGSVMDASKAIAASSKAQVKCEELIGRTIGSGEAYPTLLAPTTAGTGSELSKGAIVSFPDRNLKTGLRGDGLFAAIALVDPELCLTLPRTPTAVTGFDVLTHAIESYFSRQATPMTDLLAQDSIRRVARHLPRLLEELSNLELRAELSYASMLMGINLANSSTCLPHRLQYPVGAHTDTAHAAGLAALYPAWFEGVAEAVPDRAMEVLRILDPSLDTDLSPQAMTARLRQFMDSIGVTTSLSELGVEPGDVDLFVGQVEGNLKNDPGDTSRQHLDHIYRTSL